MGQDNKPSPTSRRHRRRYQEDSDSSDNEKPTEPVVQTNPGELQRLIDSHLNPLKSTECRIASLKGLCTVLSTKCLPDCLEDDQPALTEYIQKSLRKGQEKEQELAAKLLALYSIRADENQRESIFDQNHRLLQSTINDDSVSAEVRAQCCTALSICSFLALCDPVATMKFLHTVIYSQDSTAILQAASLKGWSLLLTLVQAGQVHQTGQWHINYLMGLLDSSDLDVRTGAGEAIATLCEKGRQHSADFAPAADDKLLEMLREMATDTQRSRAKRDLKQQRSCFRDILAAVEKGECPQLQIEYAFSSLGNKTLILDTWSSKQCYDSLCLVLGEAMNFHLERNELIREVVGIDDDDETGKPNRNVYRKSLEVARQESAYERGSKRNFKAKEQREKKNVKDLVA